MDTCEASSLSCSTDATELRQLVIPLAHGKSEYFQHAYRSIDIAIASGFKVGKYLRSKAWIDVHN